MISGIVYFREIILKSLWNIIDPSVDGPYVWNLNLVIT